MAIIDRRGVSVSAVDAPIQGDPNPGLAIKAPVVVATTAANIVLAGVQTIDGVSVGTDNERVLVKDQTDQTANGLYNAATGQWTRTIDANSNDQFTQGTYVAVAQGSTYAGAQFQLTSPNPIVLGTSHLTFAAIEFPNSAFEWTVNGGGVTPSNGYADDFEVPFACTILAARLYADIAGNLIIDILRSSFAGFPPTASICGSDKPTLANASSTQDTTLAGWTIDLNAGDVLRFKIVSVSTLTRFTLSLRVQR